MLTLRLPAENRPRGLAEKPAVFEACKIGSSAGKAEETVSNLSTSCPYAMQEQLLIACHYGAVIERVAAHFGLLPSIIAGFCSRRSGWGLDLTPTVPAGTLDHEPRADLSEHRRTSLPPDGLGFMRGLMGLDFDQHAPAREPGWRDPENNLKAAFDIIAGYQRSLRRRTTLQGSGLLRASLAAFECGIEPVEQAIRAGLDVDSPTVGRIGQAQGCGRDVLARANVFQEAGWD